jgi:Predicted secreted (periplasmic) protein
MSLLDRKVRGFRLVDLIGVSLLVVLILGVYLAKTIAGRERAEIAAVERQIKAEQTRIRLLQAEVAHLEQPGRIERLSVGYLKMEPVTAGREATVEQIIDIARAGPPKKEKPVSIVAAMVNESDAIPGVPPPPPPEALPLRIAEASR